MPNNALLNAVKTGRFREAVDLLETHSNQLNDQDERGNTVLHYIARNKSTPHYFLTALLVYINDGKINFDLRSHSTVGTALTLALNVCNITVLHFLARHSPAPPITFESLYYAIMQYPHFNDVLIDRLFKPKQLSRVEKDNLMSIMKNNPHNALELITQLIPNNSEPPVEAPAPLQQVQTPPLLPPMNTEIYLAPLQEVRVQTPAPPPALNMQTYEEEAEDFAKAGAFVDEMMDFTSHTFLPAFKRQHLDLNADRDFTSTLQENAEIFKTTWKF